MTIIRFILQFLFAMLGDDPDADYELRELAGELSPAELARDAAEERVSRERLASQYSTYSD